MVEFSRTANYRDRNPLGYGEWLDAKADTYPNLVEFLTKKELIPSNVLKAAA